MGVPLTERPSTTTSPSEMNVNCSFCGDPVDTSYPGVFRKTVGWAEKRKSGGANSIRLPVPTDEWAHSWCIERETKKGINARQESMFDEPPPKQERVPKERTIDPVDRYPKTGTNRHEVLVSLFRAGQNGLTEDDLKARTEIKNPGRLLDELVQGGWAEVTPRVRGPHNVHQVTVKAIDMIRAREQTLYLEVTRR